MHYVKGFLSNFELKSAFLKKIEIMMTLQIVMEKYYAKTVENTANIFWKAYVKKRFQMTYLGHMDNKTISS